MMAKHRVPRRILIASSALALAGAMTTAHATGFQIREQSAKTLANSLANAAAGAEDASFMAYNPAAIGNIDGNQVAGGLAFIDADFDLSDGQASAQTPMGPVPYSGSSGESGESELVPSLAAKYQFRDDLDLGIALYAPYGLATEYDDDWIGRYHAIETELKTIDIQPTINYRLTDRVSLGAGLRFQYADATLTNALDLGAMGAQAGVPGAGIGQNDGMAEVTGDDWGVGYTIGALFDITERTRFGVSYRSKVELELEGDAEFSASDPVAQAVLQGAQAQGRLTDTDGTAELTTPGNLNIGVYHQATDRLAVMANAEWTRWSEFDELVVEFGDNTPDSVTKENWDNSWALSVGANYALNNRWLLRGGVGIDETPVPDAQHRTPRVPDVDRTWLSVGATFSPSERLGVTAALMHIFFDEGETDLRASDPGNASRGNLSGEYDGSANVIAVSADYRF
ncbi:OmpP1/FadL family transporter [Arhodomonas sp. AD133]|uniref:OmpP1/FadL family transporter n=1 Tax=Arhodomonas sp. AD133 TaxID=3415009 RepID=UPI003EB6EF96